MVFKSRSFDFLLHLNADEGIFNTSRHLRRKMTAAEKLLWKELRNRRLLNLKFRRQHPLHYYVADFYCHEIKLVIEVDGGINNKNSQIEHDENRSAELERFGIRVIRFRNEEIIGDIEDVKKRIIEFINNSTT